MQVIVEWVMQPLELCLGRGRLSLTDTLLSSHWHRLYKLSLTGSNLCLQWAGTMDGREGHTKRSMAIETDKYAFLTQRESHHPQSPFKRSNPSVYAIRSLAITTVNEDSWKLGLYFQQFVLPADTLQVSAGLYQDRQSRKYPWSTVGDVSAEQKMLLFVTN